MKFLVFIKQVPNSADIRFDHAKKTLIRSGIRTEINPYDRRALSEAIRYRNENGGEVTAITMGPESARDGLLESLIMGVDSAIHINDSRLAASDTLATARVLAAAARKLAYDIIFCGQHSTDSETGQVPVELAELLGIPCAPAATKLEYLPDHILHATCETEEGRVLLEIRLPAVVSTAERLIKPIKTKNADLSTAPAEKITDYRLEDLELSTEDVGAAGSPTWVADIRDVHVTRSPEVWDGSDVISAAKRILQVCRSRVSRDNEPLPALSKNSSEYWCWTEIVERKISPASLEIISTAATLGAACAIVNATILHELKGDLGDHGARKIFSMPSDLHADDFVSLVCEKIQEAHPFAVFFPASSRGRYFAGRIAARMQLGLTGDCVGLSLDTQGRLCQWKPAFGGNIIAPIYSKTSPQIATIRAGALHRFVLSKGSVPEIIQWESPKPGEHRFSALAEEIDAGIEALKINEARSVVCVGAGIGQANVLKANRLATLLQGSLAATRRVVDLGWLPRQYQVGLTGKFIAPEVYIGLGVSGRYNHMIGVQKSGTLIAINSDPKAEVFTSVDIGIIGDAVEILNAMLELLEPDR